MGRGINLSQDVHAAFTIPRTRKERAEEETAQQKQPRADHDHARRTIMMPVVLTRHDIKCVAFVAFLSSKLKAHIIGIIKDKRNIQIVLCSVSKHLRSTAAFLNFRLKKKC